MNSSPIIVGVDWERDGWRLSAAGQPALRVSRDALLSMEIEADLIVAESAHFKEKPEGRSPAQIYSVEELSQLKFADRLRLFSSTPGRLSAMSREVGNVLPDQVDSIGRPVPDKEKDAETIALYAAANPQQLAAWKKFRQPADDPARRLWEPREELRQDMKRALQDVRFGWSKFKTLEKHRIPAVSRLCDILGRHYDELDDDTREAFGIGRLKCGPHKGEIRISRLPAALTVYLAVYDVEGNLRVRPDGKFIGVKFILKAVGLCNSWQPNMARSQLTHHGMRHFRGGREGQQRGVYMRSIRRLIAVLRDDSTTCYT